MGYKRVMLDKRGSRNRSGMSESQETIGTRIVSVLQFVFLVYARGYGV